MASLLLLVLAFGACERREEASPDWPNILLISLDALRADHLGAYGYHRPTSPFLDELAGQGVLFSNALVNTHGTPPSHTTLLTSLYQETHLVGISTDASGSPDLAVPEGVVMLQEMLYARGYQALAVTDGGYMSADYGFDRGFEVFQDGAQGVVEGTRQLIDLLRGRLRSNGPIFAFLHTYEIHSPYIPPEPYRSMFVSLETDLELSNASLIPIQDTALEHLDAADLDFLRARYDGGIRYTDDILKEFFGQLRTLGFLENCLVIVTSDHGEEFGDHGGLLHRSTLYEELLRVPLIVWGAGLEAGMVDDRPVSSVDVVPTVLARLGLTTDLPLAGVDLFSPDRAQESAVYSQYGRFRYSIRTRRWKLIETQGQKLELYDLLHDPAEQVNLADAEGSRAPALRERLHRWRDQCPQLELTRRPAQPTAERLKRLRSLGYVN